MNEKTPLSVAIIAKNKAEITPVDICGRNLNQVS